MQLLKSSRYVKRMIKSSKCDWTRTIRGNYGTTIQVFIYWSLAGELFFNYNRQVSTYLNHIWHCRPSNLTTETRWRTVHFLHHLSTEDCWLFVQGTAASHRSSSLPCPGRRKPVRRTPALGYHNAFAVSWARRRMTDYIPTIRSTPSTVHAGCSWSPRARRLHSQLRRSPAQDCHNPAADTCNNRRPTRRACRGWSRRTGPSWTTRTSLRPRGRSWPDSWWRSAASSRREGCG